MFEKSPSEVNAFLANPSKYLAAIQQASDAAARQQLENVVEILVEDRCVTIQDCIAWARRKFEVHLEGILLYQPPFCTTRSKTDPASFVCLEQQV